MDKKQKNKKGRFEFRNMFENIFSKQKSQKAEEKKFICEKQLRKSSATKSYIHSIVYYDKGREVCNLTMSYDSKTDKFILITNEKQNYKIGLKYTVNATGETHSYNNVPVSKSTIIYAGTFDDTLNELNEILAKIGKPLILPCEHKEPNIDTLAHKELSKSK